MFRRFRTFSPVFVLASVVLTLCVGTLPGRSSAREPGVARDESLTTVEATPDPVTPVVPDLNGFLLWSLNYRGDVAEGEIIAVSVFIANELERAGRSRVIRHDSISSRPECGFSDLDCMLSVTAQQGAATLVYGDLSRAGGSWLVSLFAVSAVEDGAPSCAASRSFSSLGEVQIGMSSMVRDLLVSRGQSPAPVLLRDPSSLTRHRVTVSPTAVGMEKGDFTVTGYGLGVWELQYGVHENVQVGALTLLPVGVAGLVPLVSAHYRVNENFAVGGGAYFGIVGTFTDMELVDNAFVIVYGGSFQMTGIWGKHSLNASLIAGSAAGRMMYDVGDSEGTVDHFSNLDGAYMLPSIGYRYEVHPNWSLQFEVAIPVFAGPGGSMDADDVVTMIFYGVRGHAGLVYGDLGFMIPAHREYFTEIWKYTPIGIPYFSLGFAF